MTQEGSPLLVGESDAAAEVLVVKAAGGLENPNEGQDGEGEGGPVNEAEKVQDQVEFPSPRI